LRVLLTAISIDPIMNTMGILDCTINASPDNANSWAKYSGAYTVVDYIIISSPFANTIYAHLPSPQTSTLHHLASSSLSTSSLQFGE
jgi:hypothetical protein